MMKYQGNNPCEEANGGMGRTCSTQEAQGAYESFVQKTNLETKA